MYWILYINASLKLVQALWTWKPRVQSILCRYGFFGCNLLFYFKWKVSIVIKVWSPWNRKWELGFMYRYVKHLPQNKHWPWSTLMWSGFSSEFDIQSAQSNAIHSPLLQQETSSKASFEFLKMFRIYHICNHCHTNGSYSLTIFVFLYLT